MWCESINELDPYKAVIDDRKTDWQRETLAELLSEAGSEWVKACLESDYEDLDNLTEYVAHKLFMADYLLAHGVSVVSSKVVEEEKK